MGNYCVYVRQSGELYWVKTFYESRYKNERGAYKAANRFAKIEHEKRGYQFVVIKDEK